MCIDLGAHSLIEKGERVEVADAPQLQFNSWLYDSLEHYYERWPIEEKRRAERSNGEIVVENPE